MFPAFPYEPYDIQRRFMESMYATLETGGVGLFESPTGTGKTLSIICSVLQWLEDRQEKADRAADQQEPNLPDWLVTPACNQQKTAPTAKHRNQRQQHVQSKAAPSMAEGSAESADPFVDSSEAEHLLDIWESDSDKPNDSGKHRLPRAIDSSSGDSDADDAKATWKATPEDNKPKHQQVFFCSRTHSQLSQFVSELQRTTFADSITSVSLASRKALCVNDSVLKLGALSRINERCLDMLQAKPSKKQATGNSDKKPKARTAAGSCPFLRGKTKAKDNFKEAILAQPVDVEELGKLGRRKMVCPYYTARSAVPEAQLVLLPYSALLSQESRDSLGLHLKGSIIVVDEAHNLVDAVNGIHCAEVSINQLNAAETQLTGYFERFRTRLASGNSRPIQALISLAKVLRSAVQLAKPEQQRVQTVNDFLFNSALDGVNMFKLLRYAKESKVLFKVAGYADSARQQSHMGVVELHDQYSAGCMPPTGSYISALHALVGFMSGLTNADGDGRIILDPTACSLKFVLLNAAAHFSKVVEQAHAVVLASGTLSPIASLTRQLFPTLPPSLITHFSCGHVVPKQQLLALAVAQGPSGAALQLRHGERGSDSSLDEVGRLLLNICTCTPQGVVAFFPSFAHCEQLYMRWQKTGLLAQLSSKKAVFREPRAASEVDSMLQQYAQCVAQASTQQRPAAEATASAATPGHGAKHDNGSVGVCNGGLVLCVVGGKLSEGINFSDGFGRCVVMVGMPYPNPTDPELQERMRFMDTQQQQHVLKAACPADGGAHPTSSSDAAMLAHSASLSCGSTGPALMSGSALGKGNHLTHAKGSIQTAGREYYEDLCMKAVNQCVGRVIRHRNDYAAIVLADARWGVGNAGVAPGGSQTPVGPLRKLPEWIQGSLIVCNTFGDAYGRLHRFHRQMLEATTRS
ncbi:TPA: hypothetical protein ACH3X2_005791 [Trebouxia sp. C0005]